MKLNIYLVIGVLLVLLILLNKSPYATPSYMSVQFIENNVQMARNIPIYTVNISGKQYGVVNNLKITTPVITIRSMKDTLAGCANACNSTTKCTAFTRISTNGPNKPSTCTLMQNVGQNPVFTNNNNMDIYGKVSSS